MITTLANLIAQTPVDWGVKSQTENSFTVSMQGMGMLKPLPEIFENMFVRNTLSVVDKEVHAWLRSVGYGWDTDYDAPGKCSGYSQRMPNGRRQVSGAPVVYYRRDKGEKTMDFTIEVRISP